MKKIFSILLFLFAYQLSGQISVTPTSDADLLLNSLKGQGVDIFNMSFKGDPNQRGIFQDRVGTMGIRNGIILATGDIGIAVGPNSNGGSSTSSQFNYQDDFLDSLFGELSTNGIKIDYFDLSLIEFDFVPKGDQISFKFVFASDEYTEDDDKFPDVFGFYIEGPGVSKSNNLARLPDGTPVSTFTVNDLKNNSFYIDNGSGSTPQINIGSGFDGYTKVLETSQIVIPCAKYHIKFVIADARDQAKDSGVLIETQSFNSRQKPILTTIFESPDSVLIEGCADGELEIKLANPSSTPFDMFLKISGIADKTDLEDFPADLIVIPPFVSGVSYDLKALKDIFKEGEEFLTIQLIPTCDTTFISDQKIIKIRDQIESPLKDYEFCNSTKIQLNYLDTNRYDLDFQPNPILSCTKCDDPFIVIDKPDTLFVSLTEVPTGCSVLDSIFIKEFVPVLEYSLDTNANYTVLDIFGNVTNTNLTTFNWTVDGQKFDTKDFFYQIKSGKDSVCIPINILAFQDSLKCSANFDTTICKINKFIIPNVLTPNGDKKNDFLTFEGIQTGFWKLEVYNRYGKLIFMDEKYKLDFPNEEIGDGTYFFRLSNPVSNKEFKNWLQIIR